MELTPSDLPQFSLPIRLTFPASSFLRGDFSRGSSLSLDSFVPFPFPFREIRLGANQTSDATWRTDNPYHIPMATVIYCTNARERRMRRLNCMNEAFLLLFPQPPYKNWLFSAKCQTCSAANNPLLAVWPGLVCAKRGRMMSRNQNNPQRNPKKRHKIFMTAGRNPPGHRHIKSSLSLALFKVFIMQRCLKNKRAQPNLAFGLDWSATA